MISQVFCYTHFSLTNLPNPISAIILVLIEHFFLTFPSNFVFMSPSCREVSDKPREGTGRRGICDEDGCVVTAV